MKKLLAILPLILFSGCTTTNPKNTDPYKVIDGSTPYIRAASAAAVKIAIQYSEKDPEKRVELRDQINMVSFNLQGLLNNGQFNPSDVTKALKVKEPYISNILETISVLYSSFYDKLKQDDNAALAITVLEALAQGVKEGTS